MKNCGYCGGHCTRDCGTKFQTVEELHAGRRLVVRQVLMQIQGDVAVRDVDGIVRANHVENCACDTNDLTPVKIMYACF